MARLGSAKWSQAQANELAEARAHSDALTLSQRMEEAIAWFLLTVIEIAERANSSEELDRMLAPEPPPPSLRSIWEQRHPPKEP